jgi:hypothetical protein
MRFVILVALVFMAASVSAQTATPGAEAAIYATLTGGQLTRFEYSATASDVQIANLLMLIFLSVWAFFLTGVFVLVRNKR